MTKPRKPFRDSEGSIIRKEVRKKTHTGRTRTEVVYYARVRYTDPDGKRREKKRAAASYDDAVIKRRELHDEIKKDLDPNIQTESPKTFDELCDYFEEEYVKPARFVKDKKVSGIREDLEIVRRQIKLFRANFGPRLLRNITYEDLRAFKNERLKTPVVVVKKFKTKTGVKAHNGIEKIKIEKKEVKSERSIASVHRELARLKRLFYVAVRKGWLSENPFSKGEPLIKSSDETVRVRVLSVEEEKLLYRHCTDERTHLKNIVTFAIDTFMRSGEIFKLTWSMVDLDNGLLTLPARITKTLKSRTVPLSDRALKVLLDLEKIPHKSTDTVFGIRSCKTAFAKLKEKAGLADLHFHDLRATGITRLLRMGMDATEVMKFSGHTDYKTFMKYVRPDEDTYEKARNLMNTFIER